MIDPSNPEALLRTPVGREAVAKYAKIFSESTDSLEAKLQNFPKYVRRQDLTRLLSRYEIFKKVLEVKGSTIECGVYRGFGLMAWANFSAIPEPANLTRRIYGFDSFNGFTSVSEKDGNRMRSPKQGELSSSSHHELVELIKAYDSNRFLGHIGKVELVVGDATKAIPEFVRGNAHLVVSLLFLPEFCTKVDRSLSQRGSERCFDSLIRWCKEYFARRFRPMAPRQVTV